MKVEQYVPALGLVYLEWGVLPLETKGFQQLILGDS